MQTQCTTRHITFLAHRSITLDRFSHPNYPTQNLTRKSLKKSKKEEEYTQIEGKSYAIGNFSESIAGLIGGLIASVSIVLPIQIQTVVLFFSIPVATD